MSNVVGTATIRILPDTSAFSAALNKQTKAAGASISKSLGGGTTGALNLNAHLGALNESLGRLSQRMILTGEAMTFGLTRPILGAAKAVVGAAADFDHSMKTIAAVANIDLGDSELVRLGDRARELSREFPLTANEIAEGFVDLARAGLDTAEKIDSVIVPTLQMATVEGIKLADAAEYMVNIFTGFGGDFEKAGGIIFATNKQISTVNEEFTRMGDILAYVSAATTTDMVDLANAFRYAGPLAATAGLSFEETSAALGLLAQAGFKASTGGTALRNVITRLAIPTQQSQEMFDKLGLSVDNAFSPEGVADVEEFSNQMRELGATGREINEALTGEGAVTNIDEFIAKLNEMGISAGEVFDEFGQMRPLVSIVDTFVKKGARIGDVMKLFAQRGGPAFLALMKQREAFFKLTQEAGNAEGAMTEMFDKMASSAQTRFQMLKNAFVDLAISIGESGVLDFFVSFAERITEFVRELTDSNPEIFKFGFVVAGLVAALGPLNIILGLTVKLFQNLVRPILLFTSPMGAVAGIVAIIAAGFALLVAKSEQLRSALGTLGQVMGAAFGPIFETAEAIITGIAAGAGELARILGDQLAGAVNSLSEAILGWVNSGGLDAFLAGMVERVRSIAESFVNLYLWVRSINFQPLIDGLMRVRDLAVEFWNVTQPIRDNLIPAVLQVASAIGTTLAIALGVAWTAMSKLISLFDLLLNAAAPIINFLGGNLGPVLLLLAARFLGVTRVLTTASGEMTRLGSAASNLAQRLSGGILNIGARLGASFEFAARASRALQNGFDWLAARGGAALNRLAMSNSRFGSSMSAAGKVVENVALRMGAALERFGQRAIVVMNNAQLVIGGFFSGSFVGNAENLTQAIMGLAPAFVGMFQAIRAGIPELAVITALATIVGMIASRGEEVERAWIQAGDAAEQFFGVLEQSEGAIRTGEILRIMDQELSKLGAQNYSILTSNLEELGLSINDFASAASSGADGARDFAEQAEDIFSSRLFQGGIGNLSLEISGLGEEFDGTVGSMDDLNKAVQYTNDMFANQTPVSFNLAIKGANGYTQSLGLFTKASFEGADAAQVFGEKIDEAFRSDFLGGALFSTADAIELARTRYEAMAPVLEGLKKEEEYRNDRTKDWVDRINDANSALSEMRNKIKGLFEPIGDVDARLTEMADSFRSNMDAIVGPDGLRLVRPEGLGADALAWDQAMGDLRTSWAATMADIAGTTPFGPDAQAVFESRVKAARDVMAEQLTKEFGINLEQANQILDVVTQLPEGKTFNLDLVMDERLAALAGSLGLTAQETDAFRQIFVEGNVRIIGTDGITSDAAGKFIQGVVEDNIPPTQIDNWVKWLNAATPEQGAALVQMVNSGLSAHQVDAAIAVMPAEGTSSAAFNAVMAMVSGGVIPPREIPLVLSVTAQLPQWIMDLQTTNPEKFMEYISAAAVGLPLAMGGIINSPLYALVGEDGSEVVIPLTKPERAAQLLRESGLYEFAVQAALNGGRTPGSIISGGGSGFGGTVLDPSNLPSLAGFSGAGGAVAAGSAGGVVAGPGQVDVNIVLHLIGVEETIASINSVVQEISSGLGRLQSEMAGTSLSMVFYINGIIAAFRQIPPTMTAVGRAIADGFRNPMAFIGSQVWPPFAKMINDASSAFDVGVSLPTGFSVPVYHSGGVVGEGGPSRSGGKLSSDELFALLQTGEGVMTREMMANMTRAQLQEFRRGNSRWMAVGGPYESGKAWAEDHDALTSTHTGINDTYNNTVKGLIDSITGTYPGNASAEISAAAMHGVSKGAIEWVKGANEVINTRFLGSIGLPPDFDLTGTVPEGFDIAGWRSFLGSNKRPGSYPLLMAYLNAAGIPYLVNSAHRPGDGTSYHASARAVDFGAPNDANYDSPGLLRINHALAPMLGVLSELIYAGPGGISDKAYDAATMAAHHNHVHAALANGAIVDSLMYAMLGERGREVVLPLDRPGRALDLAVQANLFSVLDEAARARRSTSLVQTSSGGPRYQAPAGSSSPSYSGGYDGGPLGGGPGNTYNIQGVSLDQVRSEIKHRDMATRRKRR